MSDSKKPFLQATLKHMDFKGSTTFINRYQTSAKIEKIASCTNTFP